MKLLGVQVDAPYIRLAISHKGRRSFEVCSLQSYPLTEWNSVKQLYIENFKGRVATGISAKELLLKWLELKIKNQRLAQKAIAFQSDATSYFDPKEMLVVPEIQKKGEGATEALLYSTPRASLKTHLEELKKLGIDPDKVSAIPEALCAFFQWKFPEVQEAILVDLGSSEWTVVLIEGGRLKKAHAIDEGVEVLLENFLHDRRKVLLPKEVSSVAKQTDLLSFHSKHLLKKLQELRQELAKTLYSFQKGSSPKPILFTGQVDTFIHLPEFLFQELKEIGFLEPGSTEIPIEEKKCAVSIGLCLEEDLVQLRREEFFPRKNWRRLGVYALFLLSASLFTSVALFTQGLTAIEKRKEALLSTLPTSLNRWVSTIETNKKEYPYISKAPKVAEVLSWLSTHPLLELFGKEGDPISIVETKYKLVKFPKIGALDEPYQAKVEIEFKLKNGMNARKFHEALLKGDEMVNPHLGVSWEATHDSYRTAFYLKNRGPHVH